MHMYIIYYHNNSKIMQQNQLLEISTVLIFNFSLILFLRLIYVVV